MNDWLLWVVAITYIIILHLHCSDQTHPQASPSLPSTPSGPVAKSPLVHSPLVVANPGDLVTKKDDGDQKVAEVDNIYRKRVTWPGFWMGVGWLRA